MFIKKKKIPNTQTKTKPSNPRMVTSLSSSPQRAHRCCYRLPSRPSSQIGDRRTQIALPLLRCSVLATRCSIRPSLKVFRSFSLWLSLSLSLFISLKLKRKWIADRHRRSVIALGLCLCSGERCSLLTPSGSPALPQGFSLWISLKLSISLSLYLTK